MSLLLALRFFCVAKKGGGVVMGGCSCPYRNGGSSSIAELQLISSPEMMPAGVDAPHPPFFGSRGGSVPLSAIDALFDQTAIVEQWGYKNRGLPLHEYQELLDSGANRTYDSILRDIKDNCLVDIRYRYGHFYAQGSGNFLLLSDTDDLNYSGDIPEEKLKTLLFRRSLRPPFRNIPDYFHQVAEPLSLPLPPLMGADDEGSGVLDGTNRGMDVVSLGVFTLGEVVSDMLASLLDSRDYKGYYFYHVMFSNLAAGVCDYVSNIIRDELNLGKGRGLPHVFTESQYTRSDDLGTVLELLGAESLFSDAPSAMSHHILRGLEGRRKGYRSLGSRSREGYRLDSNYSRGFVFTHHPDSTDLLL